MISLLAKVTDDCSLKSEAHQEPQLLQRKFDTALALVATAVPEWAVKVPRRARFDFYIMRRLRSTGFELKSLDS